MKPYPYSENNATSSKTQGQLVGSGKSLNEREKGKSRTRVRALFISRGNLSGRAEGCPIYPHRVESSKARVDPTYRKSSGERLSVKFFKEISV